MNRPNHNLSPDFITKLSRCEVFVFGSNLEGEHLGGASRIAYEKFGAEWGVGDGPTGRCYAIPTMHGSLKDIKPYVDKFTEYAKAHPMNRFLLTRIGCGVAGFTDKQMAELFKDAQQLPNVAIPAKWIPYVIDIHFDFEPVRDLQKAPDVVSDDTLKSLCEQYRYEIGAGLRTRVPSVEVRYVRGNDDFGFTNLANCFFYDDGGLYVWEKDVKWAVGHNQALVDEIFEDECYDRGYANRFILAGVNTHYRDSRGDIIYTGDVLEIADGQQKTQLAVSTKDNQYACVLGESCLYLSDCKRKGLKITRIGTVFFQLDWSEEPQTIEERALQFNNLKDSNKDHFQKVLMARFTPNFDQEVWKYNALDILGAEYHWNH